MSKFIKDLKNNLNGENIRIVFPEGTDTRILTAAAEHLKNSYVHPIVIGDAVELKKIAAEKNIDIEGLEILNPKTSDLTSKLAEEFCEVRQGKVTLEQAEDIVQNINYFGTMLVHTGYADGLVSGAMHSTPDTVRPALQIIKTKEGVSKTSGVFFMRRGDELYVMGDCAINPTLTAEELSEVAVETAKTTMSFGITPRVALLSFSSKGSAKTEEAEKVRLATEYAQDKLPDTLIDGELQFDAAFVPSVAEKKSPNSPLEGNANVFIFPSLEAGNIGYKIAQRLGGFEAYGPILQGLNKPVNDLSRGTTTEEVYNLALFTATQVMANRHDS
ncbi:phosphate acetyltransferase [Jeotgalicoccus coquinae]|uniref:Phosphate acetyltransferase n=1 Tax=Jeotgalicoccus coquinae TaxID=709509 RepID=A0A6V7RPY3_9STAP|nr:phosphate acetyltransferase [Jeotgalicoccus coquinae]MBB6423902.1 phosphate acetyltransferase [Jeotgalicoccus coquinae]GGE24083.1 phosphate acetyltransferase [Jeotgalicoccus coquinae]CAD2080530.1 Phosphate acetyltransferase [Jeotgalicoccus coquinae]